MPNKKTASRICCLLHGGFLQNLLFKPKMEATCSSEKCLNLQQTTRNYIPDDKISQRYEQFQQKIKGIFHTISKRIKTASVSI
jgi:hypothetical protein